MCKERAAEAAMNFPAMSVEDYTYTVDGMKNRKKKGQIPVWCRVM